MSTTTAIPQGWEQTLQQMLARNGTLELSPIHLASCHTPPTWRVRLLGIEDEALIVERPSHAGESIVIDGDTPLSAVFVDRQQRWSFATRVIDCVEHQLNDEQMVDAMRIHRPADAHSAQRRDFYRVDVAGMTTLPMQLWALSDLDSCVPCETHNDLVHRQRNVASPPEPPPPQLGDRFDGLLMDISGGGMALLVPHHIEPLLRHETPFWLRITLPDLPDPLLAVAKAAHWRREAADALRVGFSFTFDHNPAHQRVVNDQICRLAAHYQRLQLQRKR